MIFRTTTLAAEYVTLEMMVPEALVGGLIGRCGSNISRIRTESGATIKVIYLSHVLETASTCTLCWFHLKFLNSFSLIIFFFLIPCSFFPLFGKYLQFQLFSLQIPQLFSHNSFLTTIISC